MSRRVKIALTVLSGLVVLIVLLGLVGPLLIDVGWVRDLLIQQAQAALGRDVRLGDVKLRLIPGVRINLTDLEVAESEKFGEEPFVKMDRFYVTVRLIPLLRKRVVIGRLVLAEPTISIVRSEEGKFNFEDIVAREPEESAARPEEEVPAPESAAAPSVTLAGIQVRNGAVKFLDKQASPHTELRIESLNVKTGELVPTEPIKFDVSAETLGGSFSAVGSFRPTPPLERMRADVDVTLRDIDVSRVKSYTKGSQSEKLSGEFTVALDDKTQTASWRGNLSLNDYAVLVPSRPGATVKGAAFSINGSGSAGYDLKQASFEGKVQVESLNLAGLHAAASEVKVGSFEFDGKGSLAAGSTVVNVQGKTTVSTLSAVAEMQGKQWDFDVEKLLLDVDADYSNGGEKSAANAQVTLNVDKAVAKSPDGKTYRFSAFRIEKAAATFHDSEISVKLPNVALGKTAFNGSGKVVLPEQGQPAGGKGEPAYDVAFEFSKVSLDELATMVPILSDFSPSGDLNLSVAAKGKGTQLPSAIKGSAKFNKVSFAHPKVAVPIRNLVGTADISVFTVKEFAKLTGLTFSVGETKVEVNADLDKVRVPTGSFTVKVDNVDVDKLLPGKRGKAESAPRPREPTERKTPVGSPLRQADIRGEIAVAKGRYKTVEFGDTEIVLHLKGGAVTAEKLHSALCGGAVDGSVKVVSAFERPTVSGKMAVQDVDIEPLVALSERAKGMVKGRVSGNLQFDVPSLDPARLLKQMKANGKVTVPRGQFVGFDLSRKLESVSRLSGVTEVGPENTAFRDLTVEFALADERAKISRMAMKLEHFDVACSGTYGLDKSLNMRAEAILSEQLSAKNRGGDVQSYFENEEGRVVVPFVAAGTLPGIKVSLDMEKVSAKALEKGKERLKKEILEEIAGKKKPGEEEKPEEKLLRELGTELLDQLLKP